LSIDFLFSYRRQRITSFVAIILSFIRLGIDNNQTRSMNILALDIGGSKLIAALLFLAFRGWLLTWIKILGQLLAGRRPFAGRIAYLAMFYFNLPN
jgi:hypothetical protein